MSEERIKLKYNISRWDKVGLNFWGIPKAGNTSIKYLLHQASGNQIKASDDKNQWVHSTSHANYITPEQAFENGYINIAVTRNPYDRFISMWKDVKRRKELFNLPKCDIIEDFISYLETTLDKRRDIHFRRQTYFIRENIICIDICDEDKLQSHFNSSIPHKNSIKEDVDFPIELKERVYNVFKEDFEKLGYEAKLVMEVG